MSPRALRIAHRIAGVLALPAVLVYAVSGAQMAHGLPAGPILGMLNDLHHTYGLWEGPWSARLWGGLAAVTSSALLVLAGTGVLMWWRRPRERRLGLVVIGASLLWGGGLLAWVRLVGLS